MAEVAGLQATRTSVFISYSRKDMAFADRLVPALEARGLEVRIDRRDLPLLEEWQRELIGFIREADAVVFLVSPASVTSEWCEWEIAQVTALNKRLAPVVIEAVKDKSIPEAIRKINFLFFTPPNKFKVQIDKLAKALNTDIGWIKDHTRLGERARRWDEEDRADALLMRGRELIDAESWILRRPPEAPKPTELHRVYIQESRAGEQARAEKEREQIARTRRFQKRSAWALASVMVLVVGGLIAALWQARQTQIREAAVMTSLAHQANVDGLYERGMRIALQGLPVPGAAPWSAGWNNRVIRGLEAQLAGAALQSRLVAGVRHTGPVLTAVFSPDGSRIVTASDDNTARVWNAASGNEVKVLRGHTGGVLSAVFSRNGTRIVTASNDFTARIWDAASGNEIKVLKEHTDVVRSAVFSPDGTRILTASGDTTARVWDAASGNEIRVLRGHTHGLWSAAFSPDGTRIVTASNDLTGCIGVPGVIS